MSSRFRRWLAVAGAGLFVAGTTGPAVAQYTVTGPLVTPVEAYPATDPPYTAIEDTRERYRAMRAATKPIAETAADVVEVGEGATVRRIEPADPSLDPSSDHLMLAGAPQDPTLLRPTALPVGFDRIAIAEPVRREMVVLVEDYDRRAETIHRRIMEAHARAVALEAAALAEQSDGGEVVVQVPVVQRTARNARQTVGSPSLVLAQVSPDSPYAQRAMEAWRELHMLHLQLVQLEAEKLTALQKRLSPDQVQVVREYRLEVRPAAPVVERAAAPPVTTAPPEVPVVEPAPPIEGEVEVEEDRVEIEERFVEQDGEREVEIESDRPEVEVEGDE